MPLGTNLSDWNVLWLVRAYAHVIDGMIFALTELFIWQNEGEKRSKYKLTTTIMLALDSSCAVRHIFQN